MCKVFKRLRLFLVGFLLLMPLAATAANVTSIKVQVVIDSLGTGHISELWYVDVDHQGTEMYKTMDNMGKMRVENFKVYDVEAESALVVEDHWDVNRGREAKKGRCGVNGLTGNNCELCWGCGDEGQHIWRVDYDLVGLVRKYDDGYGFNHLFINRSSSWISNDISTRISLWDSTVLTPENARIWAFHYPGFCQFSNGKIEAENTGELSNDSEMIIMCIFNGLTFDTPNVFKGSISQMKHMALEDSDYLKEYSESEYSAGKNVIAPHNEDEDLSVWEIIIGTLLILVGGLLVYGMSYALCIFAFIAFVVVFWNVVSLRPLRIYMRRKKLQQDSVGPYFRGLPAGGDLNRAFHIIDETNYRIFPLDKDNLYAAYLVRLMGLKALSVTNVEEKGKMVTRMKVAPKFPKVKDKEETADMTTMRLLHSAILSASGENLILEKGELKKYLEHHRSEGLAINSSTGAKNTGDITSQEFTELMGLKKFLKEFTLIETRGVIEVELWDEYLVYASLFGCADEVLKNIQKASPEYFKLSQIGCQLKDSSGSFVSDFNSFTNISTISSSLRSSTSPRSSGGGGHSSSGGGGGHSGGGGSGCR